MSDTKHSVFLIGMMGAGKTTIGRLLAQALGWDFLDADRELEARNGVPVATIFELEGEAGFRRREAAVIDELSALPNVVLATGGGAVTQAETCERLRSRGLVIHLRVSADEVHRRTRRDSHRPLLRTADPRARIEELLALRGPLYAAAAHISFQSVATNPKRLVERILAAPEMAAIVQAAGLKQDA
ncbi:MAG: shikimate kinase [Burkholderiaceae bacterium]